MERSKQQALAFLLGALLVGGVLGFSADRVLRKDDTSPMARRTAFYQDIGLTAAQRPAMDSLLDERNCRMDSVARTFKPILDSIKVASRVRMNGILTPEQRARIEQRRKDDARREAEHRRLQPTCSK
ncbi:MAG: hypothetical protein ABIP93_04285 [Gemmatimonadaceae bacterium]